jgi:hypothetical protein
MQISKSQSSIPFSSRKATVIDDVEEALDSVEEGGDSKAPLTLRLLFVETPACQTPRL